MAEPNTRIPAHQMEPVAISDGHALANGGTPQGPSPPPAAGSPLGGRASTDASGSALRLREEGAEATTPALTELAAVVTGAGTPADGGSPKGAGLMPGAEPPARAGAGAGAGAAAAAADHPIPTAAPPGHQPRSRRALRSLSSSSCFTHVPSGD